jgi:hypothetical protein
LSKHEFDAAALELRKHWRSLTAASALPVGARIPMVVGAQRLNTARFRVKRRPSKSQAVFEIAEISSFAIGTLTGRHGLARR